MLNRLLRMIKCKRKYIGKSTLTSGNSYKIVLSYKGKWCAFIFNDNFKNESSKKDFLYCLVLDAQAYDNARGLDDFMHTFGYTDEKEARGAYRACKVQSVRLHSLFNEQEIDLLSTIE